MFALYREFAMAEFAASIATGIEVYLLSSSIGDMPEDKAKISYLKLATAITLAAAVAGYFLILNFKAG